MRSVVDGDQLLALTLSRPADALASANRVLARQPTARDASIAHQARGIVLRDSGRTAEAITQLRTALRLAGRSGDGDRIADVKATLGASLGLAGRTGPALELLGEALAGSRGVAAGRVLMRRGALLVVLGRHADALADLNRAVALLRRGGDQVWEARARIHRFLAHVALGQAARADRDLVIAGEQFSAVGQELESVMAVHSRADVAFQTGNLPAALGFLDMAVVRYAALSAPSLDLALDRCAVLLAAGLAHEALVETEAAIRRFTSSGVLATRRAELLFAAARAALAAGEPPTAGQRAAAARDLFRAQHRPWWQARASFVLIQARYLEGERGGRLRAQAGRIADQLDALGAQEAGSAHLLAGRLAAEQGRAGEADRHLARAARFRDRGPTFGRPAGWLAQALRAQTRGAVRATLVACDRGLSAAAEHQRTLGAVELRAHASGYGGELAAIAQRHAVRRGDGRMLLLWSERWRASALTVPPSRPPDDPALAADLAALRDVMRRLDVAHLDRALATRLEQERRRLEDAIRARTRRTAHSAGHRRGGPDANPAVSTVEEILTGLDGHRLVELVALDDVLYAVTVVGRRTRLHTVGPVADAVREVEFARSLLHRLAYGSPHPDRSTAGPRRFAARELDRLAWTGQRLERVLLGSAAADLDGGPVVLIPPGLLHAVPWGLCPSLRDIPVRVAPSATTWLRASQARPPRRRRVALVVGPGLPGSAAEIAGISSGWPEPVVLGTGRATADRTLAALDGSWLAHIAAHGVFRSENPLFSSLRLDDGPLTVYDLARLRRGPFRLVLSSCESAVSARVGADELLGVLSALVPLGTVGLLASVVPVNDPATAPLMVALHERLRAGASFAEALLAVRLAVPADDPVVLAAALSFVALGH